MTLQDDPEVKAVLDFNLHNRRRDKVGKEGTDEVIFNGILCT